MKVGTPRGALVTGHDNGPGTTPLAALRHHGALPGEQGRGYHHQISYASRRWVEITTNRSTA